MSRLQQKAPFFTLPNQQGEPVALVDLLQKGPVVVYFYPRDGTPGCTKQACAFRDAFASFQAHGCEVVGISQDSAEAHTRFQNKHTLPFPLLTDAGGQVAKAWGVKKALGLLPGRQTFLLDRDGVVRCHVDGHFRIDRHVQDTLEALASLPAS